MHALDVIRLAGGAVGGQARRTLLSLLGVAIGVTAVVALTALGDGARAYVTEQFASLGTNVLAVLPGKVETTGGIPGFGGVPNDLTVADAEALRDGMPEASRLCPVSIGNDTISFGERSRQVAVLGSTAEMKELRDLRMLSGRFLPVGPWSRGAPVAVLGGNVADELFGSTSPLGQPIRVGSQRMRVIGVLATQGVNFGLDMDEIVIVPVSTAMQMFNRTSLFRIPIEVRAVAQLDAAEEHAKRILLERHGEEVFTIITPDAILSSLSGILGVLTLALAGIAAISLTVAGIGIMNVMLVAVSERTSEVGLLKAIGARPGQITALFITEAAILSTLGGVLGLIGGFALVEGAAYAFPNFPISTPPWAAIAAFATSLLIGVTFGVLPARKAMALDPVEALQG